jgi:hypothetical protein
MSQKQKDKLACPFIFETDPRLERLSLEIPLILSILSKNCLRLRGEPKLPGHFNRGTYIFMPVPFSFDSHGEEETKEGPRTMNET